jgi:hypothetical protein
MYLIVGDAKMAKKSKNRNAGRHFAARVPAQKRRGLTVADLKCYLLVRWLKSGVLDHIPADIVDQHAPLLAKHLERVENHPEVAAYYAARRK